MHVVYSSWGNTTNQPLVPRGGYYLPDCDTGISVPLPAVGTIEESGDYSCDAGDCHLLVVNGDTLYESWLTDIDNQASTPSAMVTWHLNRVYLANERGVQCTTHQWTDNNIDVDSHSLFGIPLNDFEVMPIGTPIVNTHDCERNPDDSIYSDGFNW